MNPDDAPSLMDSAEFWFFAAGVSLIVVGAVCAFVYARALGEVLFG